MKDGFIKVGCATNDILVGDIENNVQSIIDIIEKADKQSVKVLALPQLSITGYTVADLFYYDDILNGSIDGVFSIAKATKHKEMLIFVGMPLKRHSKIYNVAAVLYQGNILAFIPKTHLPNYAEYYEKRQFSKAPTKNGTVIVRGKEYPFGTKILFRSQNIDHLCIGCEIGEDILSIVPPSAKHAINGANIIVNLSASAETVSQADYRRSMISSHSVRLCCGYLYANAGSGESTTDMVFSGHSIIAENGKILQESKLFENSLIVSEIDINMISFYKTKMFDDISEEYGDYLYIDFGMPIKDTTLTRQYEKTPFVPQCPQELNKRADLILKIQAMALKKRLVHTRANGVVIGISGGLDSSLTLLVAVKAMQLLNRPLTDIIAVTMPCFGTTNRTYTNAQKLCKNLGVTFKDIDITKSVLQHLSDIEHNVLNTDTTYENAQARERTQVLMDIANQNNALVLGTGDLSELALGWATYNGDHMSMYATNSSVPKTLVRHLINYVAESSEQELKEILLDILDTPITPELLPAEEGKISQKTEEIVGPYILHDFFIYAFLRMGFSPQKIFRVAKYTFENEFSHQTIEKWLKVFVERFFFHQFKRNCMPDGIKIGSVSISPRSDWKMPSDAVPFSFEL